MDEMKKRILSEQMCGCRITNDKLVCRDCIYRYDDSVKLGNTSVCEMYDTKPNEVLKGGKCDKITVGWKL